MFLFSRTKMKVMNVTLYTWTLVTLLILAGCLGTGVINDTEGQSSDDFNNRSTN